MKTLTTENFRAKLHGQPVFIESAHYDTGPHRLTILVDTSGSMEKEPEGMIAEGLVNGAPLGTSISFLSFASGVEDKVDFTQDRKSLWDELMNLQGKDWKKQPKGLPRRTALLDALMTAIESMGSPRLGDSVFLITDGDENASRTHPSQVENRLRATGIRFFCFLLLTPFRGSASGEIQRRNLLGSLVEAAGGALAEEEIMRDLPMTKDQQTRITGATATLIEEATEFYRLELKLPTRVDEPRDLKLGIVKADSGRALHLEVTYPRQLLPCS